MSSDTEFDPPMTPEEQAQADRLSNSDIANIDSAILSNVVHNWRKLARVVADTMDSVEGLVPSVCDLFYAQRVMSLVESGRLESQGNLRRMRYSEVRLPQVRYPS